MPGRRARFFFFTQKFIMIEKKPLFLILQKVYFDQILKGTKTKEYRDYTAYYMQRLCNHKDGKITSFKRYQTVIFQNGYHTGARRITCEIKKISIENCFVIHLGKVIKQNF